MAENLDLTPSFYFFNRLLVAKDRETRNTKAFNLSNQHMVRLEPHSDGVVLPVRAQARARGSGVRGEQDGMLKVSTSQTAERGKANRALARIIAKTLSLRGSQIELLTGQTSARKRFLIRDITQDELARRIAAVLE